MQTYSGKAFYPRDPRADEICIEDIAHALSMICRYNGHCLEFYSVAQHSVMVSNLCPPSQSLEGLMHDAAEAYLGDMIRPLKHDQSAMAQEFILRERVLEQYIARVFKLEYGTTPHGWSNWVRHADDIALATEARDLMAPPPYPWHKLPNPDLETIVPLTPLAAKALFLKRFEEITEHRGGKKKTGRRTAR